MSEKKTTVRAAERALDILLCFVSESSLAMTEIAQQTQLNKSTVFRLLATLEQKGFVKRDPSSDKYQLGFRIWELAAHYYQSDDPAILFLSEMERLRDEWDETISLYIRDGAERIRIQAVESTQSIRHVAPVGVRMPLSVGASSKILMAYTELDRLEQTFQDPRWLSEVDPSIYRHQLESVRKQGFAISREEREAGTASIAVPIFTKQGELIAALAVSGPVERMQESKLTAARARLFQAAEQMGKMIQK